MKSSLSEAFTHRDLCNIAKDWLMRPNSQLGHGCEVALAEYPSSWGGQVPDAIGFRAATTYPESVLVKCVVSRAEFLADLSQRQRGEGLGLGVYRYLMAPEGLIDPEEVPAKWGLLSVTPSGLVNSILGMTASLRGGVVFNDFTPAFRFVTDVQREMWLLIRAMARLDGPDHVKASLAKARREVESEKALNGRLQREMSDLRQELVSAKDQQRSLVAGLDAHRAPDLPQLGRTRIREAWPAPAATTRPGPSSRR